MSQNPTTPPSRDRVDITIIGGGPTGLFGLFYAGMRGASARVIDVLPDLGGQLTALYPEKYIYDVAGFPKILAKDLARDLVTQGLQFGAEVCLGESVLELNPCEEGFDLGTDNGVRPTKTVIIAGGKGAFKSRTLRVPGWGELLGKGLSTHVADPKSYRDQRVLLVGGGDSAFDWSWALREEASTLTHIHRSDKYRAHAHTVDLVMGAADRGEIDFRPFYKVTEIHGTNSVEGATLEHIKTKQSSYHEVDQILALIGFVPNIGPIATWGLDLEKRSIKVDSRMQTNVPGVYAAGDITAFDGKLELIATGFGEIAIAVNNAVHHIDPSARVNPGHSTDLAIFK